MKTLFIFLMASLVGAQGVNMNAPANNTIIDSAPYKPTKKIPLKTGKEFCTDVMGAKECQAFLAANDAREENKLQTLKFFKNCYLMAQAHSAYMAKMSSGGESLSRSVNHDQFKERLKKFRIDSSGAAENVAGGNYKHPREVIQKWMVSPEHRENIMNPQMRSMGIAMAKDKQGRQFWTQCFSTY